MSFPIYTTSCVICISNKLKYSVILSVLSIIEFRMIRNTKPCQLFPSEIVILVNLSNPIFFSGFVLTFITN